LHSQLIIGAFLRNSFRDDDVEIEILDNRLENPQSDQLYKVVPYGGGTLEHYRVGLDLESQYFRNVISKSSILGLTVNFTQEAGVAIDIAVRARLINPEIRVVFGGSDVRARAEHYLRQAADAVVLGDGERVGPRLIRSLLDRKSLDGIPSIAYRDGETICQKPKADGVPMEEVHLPAFDLVRQHIPQYVESHEGDLPEGISPPLAYVETSRGCHETCPFCFTAGIKYRVMSSRQIEEYAEHLRSWGIQSLMMIADNELTPLLMQNVRSCNMPGRDLIIDRYRIFRRHGFRWEFSNGLQYSMFVKDGRIDEELVREMFEGCYRLFIPIEDPLDLGYKKLYGRPSERRKSTADKDEIFRSHHMDVLSAIAATGLPMMNFGLIIGWPGDTVARVHRVTDRCRELKDAIQRANPQCQVLFTPFVGIPIPGTANWFDYQNRGLIREDVNNHPEAWQFGLTTYGNFEMVHARMEMIADLNGEAALKEWTSTGVYPHLVHGKGAAKAL
jgi:radical SAM superfamily enzyme YgiQ (UPF0313 family)